MNWTIIFALALPTLLALAYCAIQLIIWLDRKQTARIEQMVSEVKRQRNAYDWQDAGKYPR